ncbi:MAG: HIT family protein [bacterium]|nr:HIT family protein [bacterium]
MQCPFCEKLEIKARCIIKNDFAFAFPTNIPIVPGHVLIAPLRCVSSFDDMTEEEVKAVFDLRGKLKNALIKTFGAEGFNCAYNDGEVAGQSVPHFHFHMLPRKKGDSGITEYEPRKFLYRTGSRAESPEEELLEVLELIRNNLT